MGRPNPQERRRHRRATIRMEAILEGETPELDLRLEVLNFSGGGFFCATSRPLEPMTRLGITFQFPPFGQYGPERIDASAVVVRCERPAREGQPHRMAACFTELSAGARAHIEEYVTWYNLLFNGEDQDALEQGAA